jgi:hypothetical protein
VSNDSAAAAPSSRGGPASDTMFVARGALAPTVYERLVKALGPRRAGEVFHEARSQFGDRFIETPQDMLDFSMILLRAGGLVQAVGRSLKVQALLRGAVE